MERHPLRRDMPALPDHFKRLPVDARGYPVPWFVAWIDGKPDFRVVRPGGVMHAHRRHTCWLCGQRLGRYFAFVIGPMCAVNRVSSEPPSHLSCAKFAARACPFLTRPMAKRNMRDMPEDAREAAGVMIERNPGVALVWATDKYQAFTVGRADGDTGLLFEIGPPRATYWFCEGREATRAEVLRSIETGYPLLLKEAQAEGDDAVAELERMAARAMEHVPA